MAWPLKRVTVSSFFLGELAFFLRWRFVQFLFHKGLLFEFRLAFKEKVFAHSQPSHPRAHVDGVYLTYTAGGHPTFEAVDPLTVVQVPHLIEPAACRLQRRGVLDDAQVDAQADREPGAGRHRRRLGPGPGGFEVAILKKSTT